MQVYDTVNRLAQEIKDSEEYVNYKMAKQAINLNTELKKKIDELSLQVICRNIDYAAAYC